MTQRERHTAGLVSALAVLLGVLPAWAREFGVHSPGGRTIYEPDETFEEVLETRTRRLVVEAAVGAGPEGNVAALLGVLNVPVRDVEIYAGFGFEANPARHYTGAVRYTPKIGGYRPYVGLGYLFDDLYVLRTYSHNVFLEAGYSWVLHQTYRLTAGLGVRYIAHVGIRDDSPLLGEELDRAFLEREKDAVFPWVPTAALRFSRAF